MKKQLSILLALALSLSLAACSGDKPAAGTADAPPQTFSVPSAPSQKAEGKLEGLLSSSYVDIMKSGKFLMRYTATITTEGGDTQGEITTAMDGKNMATVMDMMGMKMRTLLLDGAFYQVDDAGKTYRKIDLPAMDLQNGLSDTQELTYLGKGTGEVNGKSLPYEEYRTASAQDGETMRFFMDGGNLYAIVTKMADGEMTMVVQELTDKIPAGLLELPKDYAESAMPSIPATVELDEETKQQLKELQEQLETMDPETRKQLEELQKQAAENPGYDGEAYLPEKDEK